MPSRSSSSLKNFFIRKSVKDQPEDETSRKTRTSSAPRPKTAGGSDTLANIEQPRLHSGPQSSHSHERPRRHTDAQRYQPDVVDPVPAIPVIDDRSTGLNHDARSMSSSISQRFSEDVADRNLRLARPDGQLSTIGRSVDILDHNLSGSPRVVDENCRYSEGVADRNMSMTSSANSTASSDLAHIRTWSEQIAALQQPEEDALTSRMPTEQHVTRPVMPEGVVTAHSSHGTVDALSKDHVGDSELYPTSSFDDTPHNSTTRKSSTEAPLGEYLSAKHKPTKSQASLVSSLALSEFPREVLPSEVSGRVEQLPILTAPSIPPPVPRRASGHATLDQLKQSSLETAEMDMSSGDAESVQAQVADLADKTVKMDLNAAGINLTNTTETHVYTKYDPAVTKEVIVPTWREIRQEQITREIHYHDIFHRILPIKETEILPARHFIRDALGIVKEIPASAIPGGTTTSFTVNNVIRNEENSFTPRQFSASTLEGFAQDFEERIDPDGVHRSHTTWIHPPVLQQGGRETGQTVAVEIPS